MSTPLNREQWLAACATLAQTYESDMNNHTGRHDMTHTPGPWEIEEDDYGGEIWLGGEGAGMIVVNGWVNGGCKQTPSEWAKLQANARLIAAAPDMLAMLQEVADYLDRYADVIDGDDGQPEANEAMRLLVAVTDLIAPHN